MQFRRQRALLAGAAIAGLAATATAAPLAGGTAASAAESCAWSDTAKTPEERAQLLLDASSQHQKYRWLNEQAANRPEQLAFGGVEYPAQVDCTPLVTYANGAEGVHGTRGTTAWPTPLAVAATFDLELGEVKAQAHGRETFDSGKAVVLGPGVASGRNPLSGRTPEYFGEDPLLSGLMAAANVRGLEDGNPDKPALANLKHYVANEQELDRETSSSNIDERTLKQVYELPYAIAVAESDPGSVMCSYNQINSVYACENPEVLGALEDMGFDGYVMSDFGSVHSTADSLNAGLDQELNRPVWFTPARLDEALDAGEITQQRIDDAAFDVVKSYIEAGLFDNPVPSPALTGVSTPEHKRVALELAEKSAVLLKNESLLPLDPAGLDLAVIGATASLTEGGGVGAQDVCATYLTFVRGPNLDCSATVAPLDALAARVEAAGGTVTFDPGTDPAAAAEVAAAADAAIVFGYLRMGETADRTDLNLDAGGDALVTAVAAANPSTVAVVNSGTAFETPWLDDVDGLIAAWYSGEQGGEALARIVLGETNPSGRLPMSFPVTLADTPTGADDARYPGLFADGSTDRVDEESIRQVDYSEGLEVGYKWYQAQGIEPRFAFGHGLSYTDFAYSGLEVASSIVDGRQTATAAFTVTNTGDVAGDDVPQLYLELPEAAGEPAPRLVGFERVSLAPGASTDVVVELDASSSDRPFSIWDVEADDWTTVPGTAIVSVGTEAGDAVLSADLRIVADDRTAPTVSLRSDPVATDGRNGWFVGDVAVTASAIDELDPSPSVEISVDGGPWGVQESPIVVDSDGARSIAARATDAAGNVSQPVELAVPRDATAPTAQVEADTQRRALIVTGEDATSGVDLLEYRVTGTEAWRPVDGAIEVPADAVNTTVEARATDEAGNVSETVSLNYASALAPTLELGARSVAPGARLGVEGRDLLSGGYDIVLRSDPVVVGAAAVGLDGRLAATVTVPRGTEAGAHRIQLVAADGSVVAEASLTVTGAAPAGGADRDLASTGAAAALPIAVAILLLLTGLALVLQYRRRSAS